MSELEIGNRLNAYQIIKETDYQDWCYNIGIEIFRKHQVRKWTQEAIGSMPAKTNKETDR